MYDQSHFNGIMTFAIVISILAYVYFGYAQYRIAQKVGHKQPWWAWVPILNFFQVIQMAGKQWYWFLFCLIPFVNIVCVAMLWMEVAKACRKDAVWGILTLFPVMNFVSVGIMAFGKPAAESPFPPHDHATQKPAGVA